MDDFFDDIVHELDDGRSAVREDDALLPQIVNPREEHGYKDPLQAEIDRFDRAGHTARSTGSRDEFYRFVEAEEARKIAINAALSRLGNPPSAAGMAPALGGVSLLTSDTIIVQDSVARWQGEDAETGPVTVTFGQVTPLAVGASVVRPFAYLKWGSYGFNFIAEIDIGTGRQVTVNASMIEVICALDALAAKNGSQARLAAFLSFRPMVRTSPLIRTRYLDSLVQNVASAAVAIPPFAVGLLPVQMSDGSGNVQMDFYDSSNTIRYTIQVSNGSQAGSIPLTGDIVKMVVTSTGVTTQHVRLPFELSI